MTESWLEKLERLDAEATAGPWRVIGRDYAIRGFPQVEMSDSAGSYFPVNTPEIADLICLLRNRAGEIAALVAAVDSTLEAWNTHDSGYIEQRIHEMRKARANLLRPEEG